ncbi:class I SAM-dependent RNA methyltransferase [Spirillospora sp. NPDC047279]|uniref:class I SAM-dependent RNA methyltransferase n=1 Tax=Spirillospora sp. NPDC047279 TaxID=3155478 RepID=UPI0033C29CBD
MTDLGPEDEYLDLEVGNVANGGFCVARHEGRVVFVRHALPGERVRALVTDRTKNFLRADAVEILTPSADRVTPPCPFAGPGRCGGCDWQHASLPAQRALKAAVVAEQLERLAGITRAVVVEEVPYPVEDAEFAPGPGLGWRTRVQFAVSDGAVGLRRHRSHDVEPIDECLIAHPGVELMGIERHRWSGASSVEGIVSSSTGDRLVVVRERGRKRARVPRLEVPVRLVRGKPEPGKSLPYVREEVSGRMFQVSGSGFWQVHPGAAQLLSDAVMAALEPKPGEIALDLYCGVGLFTAGLAERVGREGLVVGIESDGQAVRDAKFNLRDLPNVAIERGPVEEVLGDLEFGRADGSDRSQNKRTSGHRGGTRVRGGADVVVLDPPRSGAGQAVVDRLATLVGRKIAYVSCDPATLARDLAYFSERGWTLETLRAFDAFPMTQHVECLATLVRG